MIHYIRLENGIYRKQDYNLYTVTVTSTHSMMNDGVNGYVKV